MPINILKEDTINKIAAGEVVERPANVIKELVENSLDAKSNNIEITIAGAGRQLIRIRDNGIGMSREEIPKAFTRHATSKISDFSNLENLQTLGFRGEALPSISSVSNVLIQSQKENESSGWEIKYSGGKIKESRTWAGSSGTNIEVSHLFYNTPARLKFLKSDSTEKSHSLKILEELALSWPGVSFKVISEGKEIINAAKVNKIDERIFDVLGGDFAKTLIPLEISHPNIKISGFITPTEKSLPNKNYQFLFVNRRPVQPTKSLNYLIYQAYKENLPVGRHPGLVLFLDINPAEIDINVHPTKREVRFSKEREIGDLLYKSIKTTLNRPVSISFDLPDESKRPSQSSHKYTNYETTYKPNRKATDNFESYKYPSATQTQTELLTIDDDADLKIFGQAFDLYILVQKDDEIFIIDQHAAAERVLYEKYLSEWKEKRICVQQLLLPVTLEFSASKAEYLNQNTSVLKDLGWEIDNFGGNTFRIAGIPDLLSLSDSIQKILDEILAALEENKKETYEQKIEKIIRTACKKSVKAKDKLSTEEIKRLIKDMQKCESPYTCPHGRPTTYKLAKKELEKYFKRQ